MAYNNNIPQPTDILSVSQNDILNNFIELESYLEIDHEALNSADQGKHKQVTLTRQAAAPAPVGNDANIYTLLNASTTNSELYFVNGARSFCMTEATGHHCMLASGLKLIWGTYTAPTATGVQTVVFNDGGFATDCYSITITPYRPGAVYCNATLSTWTNTDFNVHITNGELTNYVLGSIAYIAIGE